MKTRRHARRAKTTEDADLPSPKLCLKCARRRLAGKPEKPCGSCILLNLDRLAQVRANAAKPWPPECFRSGPAFAASSLIEGPSTKPARSTMAGRRA